ncbi:MAG: sulfotransferase family protein [Alphaproteobacteria bacterium]|nr:sulfotransferase family protein [Alphaproteobacteria bacterium]
MTLKIIGTGFGRTGTFSLKGALETLGFGKCYHMAEVFQHPEHVPSWAAAARGEAVDWDALFDGYQAIVDFPGSAIWRDLAAHYPDAVFIHSEREEQAWLKSFDATIRTAVMGKVDGPPGWARMVDEIINQRLFDGCADDDEIALDAYRRNSREVRAEIPADRLLIFDPSAGWAPLCAFLGVPVPDEPYPHKNKTEDFAKLMEEEAGVKLR